MTDSSIYNLAVRLSLEAPSIGIIAGAAMREFARVESSARSMDRTIKGIRFDLNTRGISGLQAQSTSVINLMGQMSAAGRSFNGFNLDRSAKNLQSWVDKVSVANTNLKTMQSEFAKTERSAASMAEQIAKIEFVNQDALGNSKRGIPGTINPTTGLPYDKTPANFAYQWLSQNQAAAEASVAPGGAAFTAQEQAALDLKKAQTGLKSRTTRTMNVLQAQALKEEQANQLSNRMLIGGAGAMMVGGMGVGMLSGFVQEASQFELSQASVEQAMRAGLRGPGGASRLMNDKERSKLEQMYRDIGAPRGFSMEDMSKIAFSLTQVGFNRPDLMEGILQPATNFIEVMQKQRGVDPSTSAKVAGEFAHLAGVVNQPKQANLAFDMFTRAEQISPIDPTAMLRLLSPFIGRLSVMEGATTDPKKRAKATDEAVQFAVLLSYLGQQSRGGTQFASALARFSGMPTRRSGDQMRILAAAQKKTKVPLFYESGPQAGEFMGIDQAIKFLHTFATTDKRTPKQVMQAFQVILGQVGGNIGNLLTMGNVGSIRQNIKASFAGLGTAEQTQGALNQTAMGQYMAIQANWKNFGIVIGRDLLPPLTKVASVLAVILHAMTDFAAQHRIIASAATYFIALSSAVALVSGPILILLGTMRLLGFGLPNVGKGFGLLVGWLGRTTLGLRVASAAMMLWQAAATRAAGAFALAFGPIGLIVAVLAGAYILNIGGMRDVTNKSFGQMADAIGNFVDFLETGKGSKLQKFADWFNPFKTGLFSVQKGSAVADLFGAHLPPGFYIVDKNGNPIGGRSAGANSPLATATTGVQAAITATPNSVIKHLVHGLLTTPTTGPAQQVPIPKGTPPAGKTPGAIQKTPTPGPTGTPVPGKAHTQNTNNAALNIHPHAINVHIHPGANVDKATAQQTAQTVADEISKRFTWAMRHGNTAPVQLQPGYRAAT